MAVTMGWGDDIQLGIMGIARAAIAKAKGEL